MENKPFVDRWAMVFVRSLARGIKSSTQVVGKKAIQLQEASMRVQDRMDEYEQNNQWWQRGDFRLDDI